MTVNAPSDFASFAAARGAIRHVLSPTRSIRPSSMPSGYRLKEKWLLVFAAGASALIWSPVLGIAMEGQVSISLTTMICIMLLGVVSGTKPAVVVAVLASIAFSAFLSDPPLQERIVKGEGLGAPILFTIGAVVSALLSGELRLRTSELRDTNCQLSGLFDASRRLRTAADSDAISRILEREPASTVALEREQLTAILARASGDARVGRFKSALLGSLGHDLRAPLAAISTAASGLLQFGTEIDPKIRQCILSTIVDESARLNRFTVRLLELGSLDSVTEGLCDERVPVADLVSDCLDQIRKMAPMHRFEFTARQAPGMVKADGTLYELALLNILHNAVRYSAQDTTVSVKLEEQDGMSIATIIDEGCGIPIDEMPRIFERSYRGRLSRAATKGTGLGLSIASAFVEFFNGSIDVRSPVKNLRGTAVTMRLPLAQTGTLQ